MHTPKLSLFAAAFLTASITCGDLAAQTTNSQYNAGFREGRIAGRAEVINNPSAYGLVSRTNIPDVRFSVATNTAFTVGVGGTNWTRFAQSGAPTNWSFNTNTGVLTGLMLARQRTVRITPYSGSKAGPRMTVQFKAPPIPTMITVQGGTLPEGSALAGTVVPTFHIGKYEVMWGEWKEVRDWAVTNGYPSLSGVGKGITDDHPATEMVWYQAVWWCNAKSEKEGLIPVYEKEYYTIYGELVREVYRPKEYTGATTVVNPTANGYRLPIDSEWEWAARGGVKSKGFVYSGSNDTSAVRSEGSLTAVGSKTANELGIHDMSGSVNEWGWEFFNSAYDPVGRRIHHGFTTERDTRLWSWKGVRFPDRPIWSSSTLGFRVARNAP